MKMKKSQSAIEFFALIGMAFVTVIFVVAFSINEMKEFKGAKEFFLIKDLALKLQKEVSIAAIAEDGYSRTFTLPDKLENMVDYFTEINNNTITINSTKTVFSVAIPTTAGKNFTKGSNTIEKTDGEIYVNS
tara:strand:- start:46 stop:441 length:396 start_codon:yes stop_codon:yes gene_type:complete